MDQQNGPFGCSYGVGDVGFDGLNVAGVEGAPFAVNGEVGLALEAVDSDGSGGGVHGDLAAVTQVEEEYLPARALGQQASLFGLRGGQVLGGQRLGKRNQLGHGGSPGGGR